MEAEEEQPWTADAEQSASANILFALGVYAALAVQRGEGVDELRDGFVGAVRSLAEQFAPLAHDAATKRMAEDHAQEG